MSRELDSQFTGKLYLKGIDPEALDKYLSRGWYRMGISIFTTHFLFFDLKIFSAVWLRLPLEGYGFTKSTRKILKKNRERFRMEIAPANIDEEKEELYIRYAAEFKGRLPVTLRSSLLDGQEENPFDSYEVRIYDGEKLIGYSIFDRGKKSITSITGIYDPEYREYSLGLYSMLEEISYGQENGYDYFYPGYFVPGNDRFDYKLRIGPIQYLELNHLQWLPIGDLVPSRIPINLLHEKLDALYELLSEAGIASNKWTYPYFEARMVEFWPVMYLEYPYFLEILPRQEEIYRIVIFDLMQDQFVILDCRSFDTLPSNYNKSWVEKLDVAAFFKNILVMDSLQHYAEEETEIVAWLKDGADSSLT